MGFDIAIRALSHPIARRVFRPIMRNRATIFMLHRLDAPAAGIRGHSVEFVTNALLELKHSGARFVSVRSLIERWSVGAEVGPDEIAFTFDDGFADQAELLQRAFIPAHCPATVFLITDFLDGKLWPWDDQLAHIIKRTATTMPSATIDDKQCAINVSSTAARYKTLVEIRERLKKMDNEDLYGEIRRLAEQLDFDLPRNPPPEYRPMTWDNVRTLAPQGIEFGPHSVTHRIFSRLSPEVVRNEINVSWARLRQELSNPLPVFAWPTGRHSDYEFKDIQIAQQAGLLASMATDNDYSYVSSCSNRDDLFRIKRFALPYTMRGVLRYGSWIERGRQLLPT